METMDAVCQGVAAISWTENVEDLYERAFPAVARFVSSRQGSFDDAKDIFHDALVIFYEQGTTGRRVVNTSTGAYILGIARYLWLGRLRDERKKGRREASGPDIPEAAKEAEVDDQRLLQLVTATGRKCMDLLHEYYYSKRSAAQIAEALGYSSARAATIKKYKCMEQLRNKVTAESLSYADFLN